MALRSSWKDSFILKGVSYHDANKLTFNKDTLSCDSVWLPLGGLGKIWGLHTQRGTCLYLEPTQLYENISFSVSDYSLQN